MVDALGTGRDTTEAVMDWVLFLKVEPSLFVPGLGPGGRRIVQPDRPIMYIGISNRHIDKYRYFKMAYRYNRYDTDTIPIYINFSKRHIDIADTIPIRHRCISFGGMSMSI
jgi:hypothetical protein